MRSKRRRHKRTMNTCRSVVSDVQSRFSTFTQMSPDVDTLGWNTCSGGSGISNGGVYGTRLPA